MKAILLLEDGTVYHGKSLGMKGETIGEVVFNTCMTGYQEILTDPSYNGQIVTMTYPLIGNYGFNDIDSESYKPHVEGFIVKEMCDFPSNFRNSISTDSYMKNNNIVGIKDIDTRSLTQHIRNAGSMFGIISTESFDTTSLLEKINEYKKKKRNLVSEVSTNKVYDIKPKKYLEYDKNTTLYHKLSLKEYDNMKVAIIDCGVKENIIRSLNVRNCSIYVFPYNTSPNELLDSSFDGFVISNGPGDPKDIPEVVETIKKLITKKPIMGICLGHQLLGLSLGGNTYKLKFGHHGGNHPVKDLNSNRVYITSQNHNYALEDCSDADIKITHINVNDNTVEGFRHLRYPIISIQYHPEAAPGPQDSAYVFDEFMEMMMEVKQNA